jgi:hypothetical protein
MLDQAKVLSLRRHEKDYIIHNEQKYIDKLNRSGTVIRKDVLASTSLNRQAWMTIVRDVFHRVGSMILPVCPPRIFNR